MHEPGLSSFRDVPTDAMEFCQPLKNVVITVTLPLF
jgi:hypothetical protein